MGLSIREYSAMMEEKSVSLIYNGPIWGDVVTSLAETLQKRFEYDALPRNKSHQVFSIFVEQMNNILMYSADKVCVEDTEGASQEVSKGIFILGIDDTTYTLKTGNTVSERNAAILKERIDYLNALDRKELRRFFMERAMSENDNPESRGAGLGLIEIAKRASFKIEYELEPIGNSQMYFTMLVTV